MPEKALADYIAEKKPLVEEALEGFLPRHSDSPAARIYEAMRYSSLAGGKRLRPILVIATAEALKSRAGNVMKAACAVEMVHTCSLILDDLPSMDDASLRRGQAAAHLVFGEATAILAADALLMEAFRLVAENCADVGLATDAATEAVMTLAREVGPKGMIGGQEVDLEIVGKSAEFETLEYICRHKTGALFIACVRLGGILSRARAFEMEALENYAKNLGLAFQVRDDILDATSSTEKLGKDVGKDSNRTTFVSQFGLESATSVVRELCEVAEGSLAALPRKSEPLVALARWVSEVEA
ncbi:MAG: polyprenyl synthetase family protein [Planctomycetota bacterium]|jgi:geranylgeranyl diphosphate synthase type II